MEKVLESQSPDLADKVGKARVLLVGAGGIGCEVLKDLILSGFKSVEVVAASVVSKWNSSARIIAHQSNIVTDATFDWEFFSRFDIVLNALDNLEARRHVNMMCLATNVPLVESGTAGLLGQAQIHVPMKTECFDCVPHETPKTFPVCTIRSTPSQPIHCIVWAKSFLFNQLFGEYEEEESSSVDNGDNLEELKKLRDEAQKLKLLREAFGSEHYVKNIFDKVYGSDIQRLAQTEEMWKVRDPPIPLFYSDVSALESENSKSGLDRDHSKWSLTSNVNIFRQACTKLGERASSGKLLDFDKDDEDALDFVTSASNLRAHCFGIQQKTRFEAKQMAGNIIPAIATTNAVISGLVVLMALKVLAGKADEVKSTYLTHTNPKRILQNEPLQPPQPTCQVCQQTVYLLLTADLEKCTLKCVVEDIARDILGFEGDLAMMRGNDSLIYDADFEDNVEKTLHELNIKHNQKLTLIDEEGDKITVILLMNHRPGAKISVNRNEPIPSKIKTFKRSLEEDDDAASKKQKVIEISEVVTIELE